jgi:LacI family gluconate utilization system Gnt-II transcriptional activator
MNDTLAMGAIDFCYEHNVRIPEQMSMISFDYELIGQRTTPAVTSVVVSPYEVGRKAAELFLQRQQHPAAPPQQVNVAYRLAVRQTTAPLSIGGPAGTDGAK